MWEAPNILCVNHGIWSIHLLRTRFSKTSFFKTCDTKNVSAWARNGDHSCDRGIRTRILRRRRSPRPFSNFCRRHQRHGETEKTQGHTDRTQRKQKTCHKTESDAVYRRILYQGAMSHVELAGFHDLGKTLALNKPPSNLVLKYSNLLSK